MRHIPKPEPGEYDPYAIEYFNLIPDDGQVIQHLEDNMKMMEELVSAFTEEQLTRPHADGEWTIKEILLHVIDDERIYAYRTLRAARNDKTALPGFEQDDYVEPSRANERSLESLLDEYRSVRMSTITLIKYLPEVALMYSVMANNHEVTVRALCYHIAGHEMHHIVSVRKNYLSQ